MSSTTRTVITDCPSAQAVERGSRSSRGLLNVDEIREATWVTILAVVVAGAVAVTLFNLVQAAITAAFGPVVTVTSGLVEVTLLVNLVLLFVIVWGLIIQFGELEPEDIGLNKPAIVPGIAVTAGTWFLMQLVGVVTVVLQGQSLALSNSLRTVGLLPILGGFIAQVFGNALYEEIVYRAFLLPQVVKKFAYHSWPGSSRSIFFLALVLSQLVFALIHVPGRLANGVAVGDLPLFLAAPFVLGVLFALIYYRTGNLFVTVGLHALVNDPVLLVNAGGVVVVPLLVVVLVVLVAWPKVSTVIGSADAHTEPQS